MITSIPLHRAQFCVSCENVTESGSGSTCPVCESRAVRPLSSFLNREVPAGAVLWNEAPQTIPQLAHFIQIMTPERIRELLGNPTDQQ